MAQMGVFRQIFQDKGTIRLMNVYKGIPISTSGMILAVDPESITVHTEKSQVVSMYHDRQTFIHTELENNIYMAKVESIDFKNVNAVLTNFKVASDQIGKRTQVRVVPADPIRSVVKTSEIRTINQGILADVSQTGLAIYISSEDFSPVVYKPGVKINLFLKLPIPIRQTAKLKMPEREVKPRYDNIRQPTYQHTTPGSDSDNEKREKLDPEVELIGTIVNIHADNRKGRYRVGVKVSMKDPSKKVLSSFISMRQAEIIREIREAYQQLASR
ncbi:MAG: hypothetical protein JEZ00_06630 [Anaerolineaceae bacterium]|nr:hypothetical protein [Anaerolineaceae bacterium]